MNQKPAILLLLFLLSSFRCSAWVNIDKDRQFELDSITTYMDRELRKDLDLAHQYLHKNGKNNEERVWLFYGYIATHFKYDNKRKTEYDAPEYTPEYTAYRQSGVCRDLSALFKELCDRSGIVCLKVLGKAPQGFFEGLSRRIHGIPNLTNHQWNVVRVDGDWAIMDPTWSRVKKVQKRYEVDENGKKQVVAKVKIVDREYYDCFPHNLDKSHKPIHPVFFLQKKVPTYTTALKKESKEKVYENDYDFQGVLDSIANAKYPEFSHYLYKPSYEYSGENALAREFVFQLRLGDKKNTSRFTYHDFMDHFDCMAEKADFILKEINVNLYPLIEGYKLEITPLLKRLKKKALAQN